LKYIFFVTAPAPAVGCFVDWIGKRME
jgi:hypothetical protein